MKMPKKILVRIRLPFSWPWESLSFSGVGTVTKTWTERELEEYIAEALQLKGLEVENAGKQRTRAREVDDAKH